MRSTLTMTLTVLALTGCFEEEQAAPPPSAKTTTSKPKTAVETPAPTPEPDPAPVERTPTLVPTEAPTEVPTPKPTKTRKPMDLLSRTAGKVELEKVDEAALNKKPKAAANDRTADAERRARAASGKSAWKPRKSNHKHPRTRIPPSAGPLERTKATGQNRDVLRTWNQARRLLNSSSWALYIKLHTPDAQKAMLAYVVQRLLSQGLQRSEVFAQRNLFPPRYKLVQERLQKYGVRPRTLALKRTGTGRKASYSPPSIRTIVAQIKNVVGCYIDLMSTPTLAGGDGTHRGLYFPGDIAGLVIQGNRARGTILEGDGRARFDVYFVKSGRTWKLAARQQTQRR